MAALVTPYTVGLARPGFVAQSAPAPVLDLSGPVKQLTDSLEPITNLASGLTDLQESALGFDWGGLVVFGVGGLLVLAAVVLFMVETGESVANSEAARSGARRVGAVAKTAGAFFG